MHLDFHPGNVVVVDDQMSGLVAWNGIGRGDRLFTLVTLLFDLAHGRRFRPGYLQAGEEEPITTRVVDRLVEVPRDGLRHWWAHISLRQVDWTIRHDYPTPEIEHYLAFSPTDWTPSRPTTR